MKTFLIFLTALFPLLALAQSPAGFGATSAQFGTAGASTSLDSTGHFVQTNLANGAWVLIGTNGHAEFHDQYNNEFYIWTNGFGWSNLVTGAHGIVSNGDLYVSGNINGIVTTNQLSAAGATPGNVLTATADGKWVGAAVSGGGGSSAPSLSVGFSAESSSTYALGTSSASPAWIFPFGISSTSTSYLFSLCSPGTYTNFFICLTSQASSTLQSTNHIYGVVYTNGVLAVQVTLNGPSAYNNIWTNDALDSFSISGSTNLLKIGLWSDTPSSFYAWVLFSCQKY